MRRVLTVMVVLILALSTVGIALAEDPTTSGEVPASAAAPVVRNAFMLPDMTPGDGPDIDLVPPYEPAPDGIPVNVKPGAYNTPRQFMGFWALMESPGGIGSITDVWVDVYHPDNTWKYQVHMTVITDCAKLGLPSTAGTPAAGASTTGQIPAANWTNIPEGIIDQCNQGLLAPYFGTAEITKDQPHGTYWYTIGATGLGGGSVVSGKFYFQVLQVAHLALDFSAVNFGTINPQSEKITDGDAVWGTPALPTVASVGNVWLNLKVDFDPMAGLDPTNMNKVIDVFDVVLGQPIASNNPLGQTRVEVDPIKPKAGADTSDAVMVPGFILPANCPVKIQFSVHPEIMGLVRTASGQVGVPAGRYQGAVKLTAVASTAQWTTGWKAALDQCRVDIPSP